ncbi:hypothetical protein ACIRQP_13450 [Streptomyces sp. NPDC102274]|uniref:hypothetical protein n=1 Tax=Streptomyces sp. NPDC102274 TaxID=3366151 RepID=UPI0038229B13
MRPMRLWTASLLLRLSLAVPIAPLGRRALATVLGAADSGEPASLRAVARAAASEGHDAVWRIWLQPWVSGGPVRRWTSPVLDELAADVSTVPGWVVDTAWTDWLKEPDTVPWPLLTRWNRPATDAVPPRTRALSRLALGDTTGPLAPALLADAAARFDHPVGERARARLLELDDPEAVDLYCAAAIETPEVRDFCVAHHLAPADEVERAVFFVRTGQYEQYQALDPNGALLAVGYRGGSTAERAALRAAMAASSGIDTLRVLAGQRFDRRDFASLTVGERDYLVRQLTGRGDWVRLWPLVPLLPLPEAADTVRRFGTWRPSAEDARELFEALHAADPLVINDGLSAVSVMPSRIEPVHVSLGEAFGACAVHDLDFSSDGRQLAFVGTRRKDEPFAGVVDLRSRKVSRLHSDFVHPLTRVAHLGPDTIVVAEDYARNVSKAQVKKIHYADRHGVRPLDFGTARVVGLERTTGDRAFLVAAQRQIVAADPRSEVFLGAADGPLTKVFELYGRNSFDPWGAAVSPSGRLAAVFGEQNIVVVDLAEGTVNEIHGHLDTGPGQAHAALSPSALVRITLSGTLNVWHDPLTSTRVPAAARVWSPGQLPTGLAWSPALHRFVAVRGAHLEILAVPPTREIPMPDHLVHRRIELVGAPPERPRVRLSPSGNVLAVAGDGPTVNLYDLTSKESALTRSMGSLNREDLAEVARLRRYPDLGPTARHALALLSACLEHGFRHDIGIGDARDGAVVGDHEIELGGWRRDEATDCRRRRPAAARRRLPSYRRFPGAARPACLAAGDTGMRRGRPGRAGRRTCQGRGPVRQRWSRTGGGGPGRARRPGRVSRSDRPERPAPGS